MIVANGIYFPQVVDRVLPRGPRTGSHRDDDGEPVLLSSLRPPKLQPRQMVIPTNEAELRAMAIAELGPLAAWIDGQFDANAAASFQRLCGYLEHWRTDEHPDGVVFVGQLLPFTEAVEARLLAIPSFGAKMLDGLRRVFRELRRLIVERRNGGPAVVEFPAGPGEAEGEAEGEDDS